MNCWTFLLRYMEFSIHPFFTQLVPRKYLQHRFGWARTSKGRHWIPRTPQEMDSYPSRTCVLRSFLFYRLNFCSTCIGGSSLPCPILCPLHFAVPLCTVRDKAVSQAYPKKWYPSKVSFDKRGKDHQYSSSHVVQKSATLFRGSPRYAAAENFHYSCL